MARRSPAIERCVAVLNHLAAKPDEQYTLSELARDLELNKATAHAMLATLVDEQYVMRDPDTLAYSLGPALIAVGTAARATYPAARLAEAPMAALSEDLQLTCL
ncbi:MAG: DNA-binding IclR family transcriptional regulator, partial [Glaciecola sp.]